MCARSRPRVVGSGPESRRVFAGPLLGPHCCLLTLRFLGAYLSHSFGPTEQMECGASARIVLILALAFPFASISGGRLWPELVSGK